MAKNEWTLEYKFIWIILRALGVMKLLKLLIF